MSDILNAKTYIRKCIAYVADKGFADEAEKAAAELERLQEIEAATKVLLHKWRNEAYYIDGDAYEICQRELASALSPQPGVIGDEKG
jgi:hypothetical protein